jgi:hypothetical protein
MTEPDYGAQEVDLCVAEALAHPDPDPDNLPANIPPHLVEQEQTAGHLLRASLRLEDAIASTKDKMDLEMSAWGAELAKLQSKREAWREIVKAWMIRNNVTQIKCPWFTASIAKGRSRIVVDDEGKAIEKLKEDPHGVKAIKVKESIIKAEFDAIYNAIPKSFEGVAHEETGEPGLIVRRAKA